jgi:mersacidin/lichenicidin family type 2 lantibiotic
MPTMEVVRAWKDQDYRDTLTAEQLAELPQHPAGVIEFGKPELDDESLFGVEGKGGCKFLSNQSTKGGQCYTHSPGQCK